MIGPTGGRVPGDPERGTAPRWSGARAPSHPTWSAADDGALYVAQLIERAADALADGERDLAGHYLSRLPGGPTRRRRWLPLAFRPTVIAESYLHPATTQLLLTFGAAVAAAARRTTPQED